MKWTINSPYPNVLTSTFKMHFLSEVSEDLWTKNLIMIANSKRNSLIFGINYKT